MRFDKPVKHAIPIDCVFVVVITSGQMNGHKVQKRRAFGVFWPTVKKRRRRQRVGQDINIHKSKPSMPIHQIAEAMDRKGRAILRGKIGIAAQCLLQQPFIALRLYRLPLAFARRPKAQGLKHFYHAVRHPAL